LKPRTDSKNISNNFTLCFSETQPNLLAASPLGLDLCRWKAWKNSGMVGINPRYAAVISKALMKARDSGCNWEGARRKTGSWTLQD